MIFGSDVVARLQKKYDLTSIKTMNSQMVRLYRLINGIAPSVAYELDMSLFSSHSRVMKALSEVDSASSKAGILNTIVRVMPLVWKAADPALLSKYEEEFHKYKTLHASSPPSSSLPSSTPSSPPPHTSKADRDITQQDIVLMWDKLEGARAKGITIDDIILALYRWLPPQIPSVYANMQMMHAGKISLKTLMGHDFNVYDRDSGTMIIHHINDPPYTAKFRVGKELRKFLALLPDSQLYILNGEKEKAIKKRLSAMFGRHVSVRRLRKQYQRTILPTLSPRQQDKVINYANFNPAKN